MPGWRILDEREVKPEPSEDADQVWLVEWQLDGERGTTRVVLAKGGELPERVREVLVAETPGRAALAFYRYRDRPPERVTLSSLGEGILPVPEAE
jgi:hypothetical protein